MPSAPPISEVRAEAVVPTIRALIAEADRQLQAVDPEKPTYDGTLGTLESATEPLELYMNGVEHLENVATTPELRQAYTEALPLASAFWSSIPLRDNLYRAIVALSRSEEAEKLDPVRRRFLDTTLSSFRRHGAELGPEDKARLSELDQELSRLTNQFSQNVLDSTNAFELLLENASRLAGAPPWVAEAARLSAESKGKSGYRLTLQAPTVIAVLTYVDDAGLRETLWRAHNTRASRPPFDNRQMIAKILELRREKARLLGFANFADLVTEDRMAKTGANARHFVDDLTNKTLPAFDRENLKLREYQARIAPNAPPLQPWDVAYYAEKLRREEYDLDEEELRQYFEAERVVKGAFSLAERLYGIRIEALEAAGSAWDAGVRAFRILDAGSELGRFYVDLFPRENKRAGAWMHGLLAASPPRPHLAVFCANVSPQVGARPALLTHREVETVFHEFGHLLHHCLSRVPIRSLACTRVAHDFVELPSQIMENWCFERESLDLFARHHETGEKLPDTLLERLRAARTFRAANAQMRQLGFATLDLSLHVDYEPTRDRDVVEYSRQTLERFAPAPLPEGYAMVTGFSHLFGHPVGYAAGYYSYKWAELLDADAFQRFLQEGVLSPSLGAEFRHKILERGDSQDPLALFVDFMGREPEPEALLRRQGIAA